MGLFSALQGAPNIERTALLPYAPEQLFALVNDIEKYPEFLPGCAATEVHRREDDLVEASLELTGAGLHYRLRTRNRLFPPHRITLELLDGPCKTLSGEWSFAAPPHGGAGCQVRLHLHFQLRSVVLRALASRFAESAADRLVRALCERAESLYGAPSALERDAAADGRQSGAAE